MTTQRTILAATWQGAARATEQAGDWISGSILHGEDVRGLATDPDELGHRYAAASNGDVWHSPDYGETRAKPTFALGKEILSLALI